MVQLEDCLVVLVSGTTGNHMPHLPSLESRATIQSSLFYKIFFFSFLFLKLDSGSYLTVTLFVGLSLVLAKALLLFCNQSFFT